jgi:aerobic-type carbon monoxide dehydrogenase small subunit (CoxS/CutS family)
MVGPERPAGSEHPETPLAFSRRSFLKGAGGALVASGLLHEKPRAAGLPAPPGAADEPETLSGKVPIELEINGVTRRLEVEPRTTLLSALRTRLDPALTGTKEVCDRGNCGACTVLLDDRPVYACMQLAIDMLGRRIRTVEGLGTPQAMSPVQEAFCERDGAMCGFCTPGFVVATTACLEQRPDADLAQIKRDLSGNLCRCGTYPHIFDAALTARGRMNGGPR